MAYKQLGSAGDVKARKVCRGKSNEVRRNTEEKEEEGGGQVGRKQVSKGVVFCTRCNRPKIKKRLRKISKICPTCLRTRPQGEAKGLQPCQICAMIYRLKQRSTHLRMKEHFQIARRNKDQGLEVGCEQEVMRDRLDNQPKLKRRYGGDRAKRDITGKRKRIIMEIDTGDDTGDSMGNDSNGD